MGEGNEPYSGCFLGFVGGTPEMKDRPRHAPSDDSEWRHSEWRHCDPARPRTRRKGMTAGASMWALLLLGAGNLDANERGSVSVAYHDGRLSLTARDASVGDILTKIGLATGIDIYLAPRGEIQVAQETVAVTFENLV